MYNFLFNQTNYEIIYCVVHIFILPLRKYFIIYYSYENYNLL